MNGRMVRWLLSLAHPPRGLAANGRGESRLTILRHHRVYADGERPLYRLGVSASVLAGQLDALGRIGVRPVTVGEGVAHLAAQAPGHRVALSFDDGYADNVERALPLLERHGARATFYLTAGMIESRRAPWWDVLAHALEHARSSRLELGIGNESLSLPVGTPAERRAALAPLFRALHLPTRARDRALAEIRAALGVSEEPVCELATWEGARHLAQAGMEVGAHTLEHPFLPLLSESEQQQEIAGSIAAIERRLGVRPTGLAYPGGEYDGVTTKVAVRCGLGHAVTTRAGDNAPGAPVLELKRRPLSDGACLGPTGRFSRRLALAEICGAFDRLRGSAVAA